MRKEIRQLVTDMESRGWILVRVCTNGHMKYRYKNGGTTIVASTPSDHRGIKNKLSEIKRIEKGMPHAYKDGKPYDGRADQNTQQVSGRCGLVGSY